MQLKRFLIFLYEVCFNTLDCFHIRVSETDFVLKVNKKNLKSFENHVFIPKALNHVSNIRPEGRTQPLADFAPGPHIYFILYTYFCFCCFLRQFCHFLKYFVAFSYDG